MNKVALISVSDKSNLDLLSNFLLKTNYNIISTGGTLQYILNNLDEENKADKNIENRIIQVSDYTGYPEILEGRVKTLHPKIYGGLLYDPSIESHTKEFEKINAGDDKITRIDLVVANLYPFDKVVKSGGDEMSCIENIDIGGVSLIRAAAKNYKNVMLLVDPKEYKSFIDSYYYCDKLINFKKQMAFKGFEYVTEYDQNITGYFNNRVTYRKYISQEKLKYGCNPYQDQAFLCSINNDQLPFKIINGTPGYINYLDALNSFKLVSEIYKVTGFVGATSFKHTAPAGVGIGIRGFTPEEIEIFHIGKFSLSESPSGRAYIRARNCDPLSSFGDFIAISGEVDEQCAKLIQREVSDGIIAFDFTLDALKILKQKKGGKFIILKGNKELIYNDIEFKEVGGVALSQNCNSELVNGNYFKNIATIKKEYDDMAALDLTIATITLKYTPSNSISVAYKGQVIGVGAGQQNRVDCIKLAGNKSNIYNLRKHPKCLKLLQLFKNGIKRQDKVNAVIKYINNDFNNTEYINWLGLFDTKPEMLEESEKDDFLLKIENVSLSSDAFFPFRDNIDYASRYGIKYIIQPGGSIQDRGVIEACNEYGMVMFMSGKRLFLH